MSVSSSIDPAYLRSELTRLEPAARASPARVQFVRAPGRVNLIGEYTDVNEGHVLPVAIDREIRLAVLPTDDRRVVLHRLDTDQVGSFDLDDLPPRAGDWIDYAVGTAWSLTGNGAALRGIRAVIGSSLPMNAGLSSSAAIELAVAHALLGDSAEPFEALELARLAQRAENRFVGVQCGLMDQFASSCGNRDGALLLDCRSLAWRPVRMPLEDAVIVVCDTGSPRRLAASEYNLRREQCERAVTALARVDPSVRALRDVSEAMLADAVADNLIDPIAARRAGHVVAENARVLVAVEALEADDLPAVAEAFAASHASLRDLFEVSSPALDALVEIAVATPGVVAARMTGAGFGGCTVNLVRPDAVERLRAAVGEQYPARTGLRPRVFGVTPVAGAGFVAV